MNMKKIYAILTVATFMLPSFAQESSTALHPEFSADVSFSAGAFNIDENETVKEVPGLSNDYDADLTINGGSFKAVHVGTPSDNYGPGCLNNGGIAIYRCPSSIKGLIYL